MFWIIFQVAFVQITTNIIQIVSALTGFMMANATRSASNQRHTNNNINNLTQQNFISEQPVSQRPTLTPPPSRCVCFYFCTAHFPSTFAVCTCPSSSSWGRRRRVTYESTLVLVLVCRFGCEYFAGSRGRHFS